MIFLALKTITTLSHCRTVAVCSHQRALHGSARRNAGDSTADKQILHHYQKLPDHPTASQVRKQRRNHTQMAQRWLRAGPTRHALAQHWANTGHFFSFRRNAIIINNLEIAEPTTSAFSLCTPCNVCRHAALKIYYPSNTRRLTSAGIMLAQRRRWWANIIPTLVHRLVFDVYACIPLCKVKWQECLLYK